MSHEFLSRIILVFGLLSVFAIIAEEMPCTAIVQDGTLLAGNVYYASDWHQEPGQLVGAGTNRFVISRHAFDSSEFRVHARLTLERREQTAATFCMGKYALGLDGSAEYPYFFEVQGVQPVRRIAAAVRFSPGEEFLFEAAGKGGRVVFSVNGEVIADCAIDTTEPLCFGFRPQRNTIRIKEFFVYGKSLGENTMQIEQLNIKQLPS